MYIKKYTCKIFLKVFCYKSLKKGTNTQKVPFFLSKKCPFKVKHAPFSSIFKSLKCKILPLTGRNYRKGTKWAKGHLYTLMGHISCHIWALIIATAEPQKLEKCPQKNLARFARMLCCQLKILPNSDFQKLASLQSPPAMCLPLVIHKSLPLILQLGLSTMCVCVCGEHVIHQF